ncbi:MAG: CarD family transcriptional regulator [Clostridiales bacterium]|nr:CarD family transcriptional regulator [Clostridiales bacterium]MDD7347856.1 CarD family transcriptional regulator [Clostridiales bacterium]MDY4060870.1 CarD family transcriptional regulator [Anaerovoracaceae bacterium]
MFKIGDRILYPMHGAGKIERIEQIEALGELRDYYVLKLAVGNLDVMVPISSSEEVGIRHIIEEEYLPEVYEVLNGESSSMPRNWNRRYRENMELLKSGDILKTAQVVRNLLRVDRVKKLSTGEKKMLKNARQILESEIVLVAGISPEEVSAKVEKEIFTDEFGE